MSTARELRLRSHGGWLIALFASACATTTTQPAPKLKPPPPAVAKKAGEAKPKPENLEALESEFQPKKSEPLVTECEGIKRASTPPSSGLAWPVDGVVITAYGKREGTPHDGIDIAAPRGTPIYASKTGEVLYSGERPGYGQMVILGHDGGMVTIYAHNDQNCVKPGAKVTQGEVIGLVGATGGATSPGVHFEVRLENKPVNPRAHLPK